MKIKTLLAMIALFALIFASAIQAKTVVDSSKTFSIDLAKNWTVSDTEDLLEVQAPNKIGRINVSRMESEGVTLELFSALFTEQLKEGFEDFKLISQEKTKIDGTKASVWVYKATVEGVPLQFKNYIVVKDDYIYNIIYVTTVEQYKTEVIDCDKMIDSWDWL